MILIPRAFPRATLSGLRAAAAATAIAAAASPALPQAALTTQEPLTEILTFDPSGNDPQVFSPVAPTVVPIIPTTDEPPAEDPTVPTSGDVVTLPFIAIEPTTEPPEQVTPVTGAKAPPITLRLQVEPTVNPTPTTPTTPVVVAPPVRLVPGTPTTPVVVAPPIPVVPGPAGGGVYDSPTLDALIGGPWGFNQSHSVRLSTGGIIVVGNSVDPTTDKNRPPRILTHVAHVNRDGHVLWNKTLSGRWLQTPLSLSVIPGDGALLLLEQSKNHGYEQALILIKPDGGVALSKSMGLTAPDMVRAVAAAPDGTAMAVGLTETRPGSGRYGFWHAWIGADGALSGRHPLPAEVGLLPFSLSLTPTAGHVFAHYPDAAKKAWGSVWVAGLKDGNIVWRSSLEGDARLSVASLRDGGALVPRRVSAAGRATLLVTRLSADGTQRWDVPLGHDLWPSASSEFADGSLFVSGWGNGPHGKRLGWFARLSADGGLMQYESFETLGYDRITAGYPYPDGTLILVGQAYVDGSHYAPARILSFRGVGYAAAAPVTAAVTEAATGPAPTPTPLPASAAVEDNASTYVAEVVSEDQSLRLFTTYDRARNELVVRRTSGSARDGRVLELWVIAGNGAPVSLGVLPADKIATLSVPADLVPDVPDLKFAVSDEPPGGSPTGAPTGQVMAVGQLLRI